MQQLQHVLRFLREIERPRGGFAAFVQAPNQPKRTLNMLRIAIVERHAVRHIARYLPPFVRFGKHVRIVKPQLLCHTQRKRLTLPIDNLLRTVARVTIHVLRTVHTE